MKNNLQQLINSSILNGANSIFIESLYEQYLNGDQLDSTWMDFFKNISLNSNDKNYPSMNAMEAKMQALANAPYINNVSNDNLLAYQVLNAFRDFGVYVANLDPLHDSIVDGSPIDGLSINHVSNESFPFKINNKDFSFQKAVEELKRIYCSSVAFEFNYITNKTEKEWLTNFIETNYLSYRPTKELSIQQLTKLLEADALEEHIQLFYVSKKRFSLEGSTLLIPMLDNILTGLADQGIAELYIGMAHRGRLNALVNIAGKPPKELFDEFDGNIKHNDFVITGDVKYHKGYRSNYTTLHDKNIKVEIAYNPSHLEAVNGVLSGMVRASQDFGSSTVGLIIHGDAAIAGLGCNQTLLNMASTNGYSVNGMIHIVVDNQIGFTNSRPKDLRSSRFSSDVAKITEMPVIHINGDDVDGAAFAVLLALEYRNKFKKDIMLNLVSYRKHGHNEADDPTITQPHMYGLIKNKISVAKSYADKLLNNLLITQTDLDTLLTNYQNHLDAGTHPSALKMQPFPLYDATYIANCKKDVLFAPMNTKITKNSLTEAFLAITKSPASDKFILHPIVSRLLVARQKMSTGEVGVDFGAAEVLSYASLIKEKINLRLTGEDSERGTFSHRHATFYNLNETTDNNPYNQLANLAKLEGLNFYIYNSILNEDVVLSFEYGYSLKAPNKSLTIWEAQFGDFANGAQVIIDQFIASAETKWGILSNLTMILPHGFDGQGPEHSSGRITRFLQLTALNNMRLVIPSTAAQYFHILRYQALSNTPKPLVIFLSKKLLRLKAASSELNNFTEEHFQYVLENIFTNPSDIKRVIFCSGQIYYNLLDTREKLSNKNIVSLIRIEQIYPLNFDQLKSILNLYKNVKEFYYVQEEPINQGAGEFIIKELTDNNIIKQPINLIGRPRNSAPACGSETQHQLELNEILEKAFLEIN